MSFIFFSPPHEIVELLFSAQVNDTKVFKTGEQNWKSEV